ncbi:MAG TPA: hypothetical protein VEW95_09190 [Candidatus Limnocylindrales bacterium]|nr:hypothetical protein [Candidatus Limnocylindrales bacterium]
MSGHKKWGEIKRDPAAAPARPLYHFSAERDGSAWLVKADDLPRVFTQVRRLDQAEDMARDVTALMLDVDPASFDVHVVARLEEPVRELVERARRRRVELELLQGQAAAVNAAAVHRLVDDGYSLRDIGAMMGISFQRAGQLAKAAIPMLDLDEMEEAVLRGATDRPDMAIVARAPAEDRAAG